MKPKFDDPTGENRKNSFFCKGGRIYFTRETERLIFFILTLGMIGWGICLKFGLL